MDDADAANYLAAMAARELAQEGLRAILRLDDNHNLLDAKEIARRTLSDPKFSPWAEPHGAN